MRAKQITVPSASCINENPKLGLAEIHEGNMSKRNISLDQAKANDKMAKLQNEHKAGLESTQLCKSTPGFQFVGKTRTIDMFLSQ